MSQGDGMMKSQHIPIIEFDTASGEITRRLQWRDGRWRFESVEPDQGEKAKRVVPNNTNKRRPNR